MNSDPYTEASDSLSRVSKAFRDENGRLPSAEEFFEILALAIKTTYDDLFEDISNYQVDSISWKGVRGITKRRLCGGDVFSVNLTDARLVFLVYLGTIKPFGDIFTCFKNRQKAGVSLDRLTMAKYPFRSSKRLVDRGDWKFVANRWDLVIKNGLFAEIYYNKNLYRDRTDVGAYGAAKRLERDGTISMRNLTEYESQQIGILGNREDMGCQPEAVVDFLAARGLLENKPKPHQNPTSQP